MGNAWAGTQADAKAAAKEAGKPWHETEVPTDKPGLLAWLNERNVPARLEELGELTKPPLARDPMDELEQLEDPAPCNTPRGPRVPGHCDACGRSAAGTLKLAQGEELDAIAQWMDTADLWALEQLADRAREVARGRGVTLEGRAGQ